MSELRFQLDEHIPRAVAEGLRRRDIDVATISEAKLRGASDEDVLAHSLQEQRVLVTQDKDFLRLHGRRRHAGIVYSSQSARSIGELITGLLFLYDLLSPEEMADEVQFL